MRRKLEIVLLSVKSVTKNVTTEVFVQVLSDWVIPVEYALPRDESENDNNLLLESSV